ncbi:hypothetical protein MA9V2_191 [Chryseobacterium phage MA9V-2]|nr:hypothetical protein MA9V2_191 [Chryseobacterium phage MA9V-2]
MKFKAKRTPKVGDVRWRWKQAWFPTKIEDSVTSQFYWLWLTEYYVIETFVDGGVVSNYWQTNYEYLSKMDALNHQNELKGLLKRVGERLDESLAKANSTL